MTELKISLRIIESEEGETETGQMEIRLIHNWMRYMIWYMVPTLKSMAEEVPEHMQRLMLSTMESTKPEDMNRSDKDVLCHIFKCMSWRMVELIDSDIGTSLFDIANGEHQFATEPDQASKDVVAEFLDRMMGKDSE